MKDMFHRKIKDFSITIIMSDNELGEHDQEGKSIWLCPSFR